MKSPFAPILLPLVALAAALGRWKMQGSGNVWTTLSKRFYVPDPDLGWKESVYHPIWLGLEICAIIAAIAIGLAIGGWIIRRREAKRDRRSTILRSLAWLAAIVSLVPPIAAFASGPGAANGRDTRPAADTKGAVAAGFSGSLGAPAGTYQVVAPHAGSSITARISAGKETFDAKLDGDIKGQWQGDPSDFTKPTTADVSVATASVDTNITERSKHAREEYLLADKYPRLTFKLDKLLAVSPIADGVAFRAQGTVGLIGKTHVVEVTGTLKRADAAALGRLGLTGDVLLVQADFSLVIKETALAPDAGDFDGDRIPVHVSLVLRRTGG